MALTLLIIIATSLIHRRVYDPESSPHDLTAIAMARVKDLLAHLPPHVFLAAVEG